jgi:hypothetical protein
MEINLFLNQSQEREELENVNILDLDTDILDGSCMKIQAIDVLDYVDKQLYLPMIAKKLRHGGELHIECVDLFDVCLQVVEGQQFDVKKYLFNNRHSVHNEVDVVEFVLDMGLELLSRKVSNYKFYIVFKRP